MYINLKVQYKSDDYSCLCFKHAVKLAMDGVGIETVVDDFGGEGDMRTTYCEICHSSPGLNPGDKEKE